MNLNTLRGGQAFLRDLRGHKLTHAYAVVSPDKAAREEFFIAAACAILCGGDDCSCGTCIKIKKGIHPDVAVVPREERRVVVSDIAEIVEGAYVLPMSGEKKIYVLPDFCFSTEQAQNKLLKILEEPPASVIFFLGLKNETGVLPTVLSRTKKLQIFAEELPLAQNQEVLEVREQVLKMLYGMNKSSDIIEYAAIFARYKTPDIFFSALESFLRDIMAANADEDLILQKDKKDDIIMLKDKYSPSACAAIIARIQKDKKNQIVNVNINFMLDGLLYCMLEERYKK